MDFEIKYLSFFVIEIEGQDEQTTKNFRQYANLDGAMFANSALKPFLDGELMKIAKRKVERHPKSEQVPTKIGSFIVEPGYDLASNPNYNMFNRIRNAATLNDFSSVSKEIAKTYVETTAARGGVLITISAKLNKYFDQPFCFILKCDFEKKVATITDEKTLINQIEMAITTKNMKSIQYPYMPEEGMIEEGELKIHQSSHAKYFEDFLKFVSYEKSMPEIVKAQVIGVAQQEFEQKYKGPSAEWEQEEASLEAWATSPKRELQEKWTVDQVMEVSSQIVEHAPEIELKLKIDHISIKGLLADFGDKIHLAKVNNRYVVVIDGDMIQFEKNVSPVEFLKPGELQEVVEKITKSY